MTFDSNLLDLNCKIFNDFYFISSDDKSVFGPGFDADMRVFAEDNFSWKANDDLNKKIAELLRQLKVTLSNRKLVCVIKAAMTKRKMVCVVRVTLVKFKLVFSRSPLSNVIWYVSSRSCLLFWYSLVLSAHYSLLNATFFNYHLFFTYRLIVLQG